MNHFLMELWEFNLTYISTVISYLTLSLSMHMLTLSQGFTWRSLRRNLCIWLILEFYLLKVVVNGLLLASSFPKRMVEFFGSAICAC